MTPCTSGYTPVAMEWWFGNVFVGKTLVKYSACVPFVLINFIYGKVSVLKKLYLKASKDTTINIGCFDKEVTEEKQIVVTRYNILKTGFKNIANRCLSGATKITSAPHFPYYFRFESKQLMYFRGCQYGLFFVELSEIVWINIMIN